MQQEFNLLLVDELFDRQISHSLTGSIPILIDEKAEKFDRSRFSNTAIAVERLLDHAEYRKPIPSDTDAPYGRFRGRHIIGTGTRVLGGVYLGHRAREAIVLDESSVYLKACVMRFAEQQFAKMCTQLKLGEMQLELTHNGLVHAFQKDLAQSLFQFTKECLPYNERSTSRVFQMANIQKDEELSLDVYLEAKTGVCRHMVLFLVAMFELLEKMSLTEGKMFVCRCYIPNLMSHAWARFEDGTSLPLILDPAQDFCGPLERGGEMGSFIYDHEYAKLLSRT